MVFDSWDIYSFSHWSSKLLTLLICAHFRSEQKGGGGFCPLYIRAKLNLVRSLTSPPTTQLNGPTTGRRILSRKENPCRVSQRPVDPLGGEAPLCTSSPVQSLRRRCLEERTPRRVENAFRTVTSPWTVEWRSNHRPLEISGLAGPDTPGESATRASHRPGPCRKG